MTLLVDVNHPGSQEDLVSNWEPSHCLVEEAVSGAKIAPCLLALAVAHLTLCLRQGEGSYKQPVSSPLEFTQFFLLLSKKLAAFLGEWYPPLTFKNCVEASEGDGNTRPPDMPLEKPICRSGSNS